MLPSARQLRVELCFDRAKPVLRQARPLRGGELKVVEIGERRAAPQSQ